MTVSPSPTRKPCPDRVRRQALQLLATTACSWNLASHGAGAQAQAGSAPLGTAHVPHSSPAL